MGKAWSNKENTSREAMLGETRKRKRQKRKREKRRKRTAGVGY